MKITGLKTFIVDAFRCNWVFVKLYTDSGITGVGEATVEMRERTVAHAIEELGRYLVGVDPFAIEHHVHLMNRDSYWRSGVILRSALSAVEAAMFDIKGKALGVPVYELLGGKCRDRIQCYANGWFAGAKTPDQFASKAANAVDLGFRALKFDPFGSAYLHMDSEARARAVDIVSAVRDRVGPHVELLIEVHGRLDVPTAVAAAHDLVPFRPFWYEEPVPPECLSTLAEVRARIPIPVAAGERFYDCFRFDEALRAGALDILQPDPCHCGGLLETRRICDLARLHSRPVSPHNPNGPIANAMTLQIAASCQNFLMLETMMTDVAWRSDVVREDLDLVDGCLVIPGQPGLGLDLNEQAAAEHPYEPHELRHYSGALTGIRPSNARPYYRVKLSGSRE
jgi:galactonate dehydratase